MGKSVQTEKKARKSGPPLHQRAGLHLPASRYRKAIKESLRGNHKVSKLTPIAVAGYLEFVVEKLLDKALESIGEKKNIRPEHLHAALNSSNSGVHGLCPSRITGFQ